MIGWSGTSGSAWNTRYVDVTVTVPSAAGSSKVVFATTCWVPGGPSSWSLTRPAYSRSTSAAPVAIVVPSSVLSTASAIRTPTPAKSPASMSRQYVASRPRMRSPSVSCTDGTVLEQVLFGNLNDG